MWKGDALDRRPSTKESLCSFRYGSRLGHWGGSGGCATSKEARKPAGSDPTPSLGDFEKKAKD